MKLRMSQRHGWLIRQVQAIPIISKRVWRRYTFNPAEFDPIILWPNKGNFISVNVQGYCWTKVISSNSIVNLMYDCQSIHVFDTIESTTSLTWCSDSNNVTEWLFTYHLGTLLLTLIKSNLILTWISNHNPLQSVGLIANQFLNFNGCTFWVLRWIRKFTHTYWAYGFLSMLGFKLIYVSERDPGLGVTQELLVNFSISDVLSMWTKLPVRPVQSLSYLTYYMCMCYPISNQCRDDPEKILGK